MKKDREVTVLGELLKQLKVNDLVPDWKPEDSWHKLEAQLRPQRRKLLPVWIYPAFAASLMFAIIYALSTSIDKQANLTSVNKIIEHAKAPQKSMPKAQFRVPANRKIETGAVVLTNRSSTDRQRNNFLLPVTRHRELSVAKPNAELKIPVVKAQFNEYKSDPIEVQPRTSIRSRHITTVYTLNEIIDEVPEREQPARQYSKLFSSPLIAPSPNVQPTERMQFFGRKHAHFLQAPEPPSLNFN